MSVWIHADHSLIDSFAVPDLSFFNASTLRCRYCKSPMTRRDISDRWHQSPNDYIADHAEQVDFRWMVEEQGITLEELELSDGDPGDDVFCSTLLCGGCGWWAVEKRVLLSAKTWQVWELVYGTCGRLRNLDLSAIGAPIDHVCEYITAKYDDRFAVHPRKFEEVVASVFGELGYRAELTAYSRDGGIDVILLGPYSERIGVQVKRYREKILVEQIRAFLGALIVNNCVRGYFVTTSDYSSGASVLAQECREQYRSIELINDSAFFEMLKVAPLSKVGYDYPFDILEKTPSIKPIADLHLNSL